MTKKALRMGLGIALCGFLLYLGIHYWPGISSFAAGLLSASLPLFLGFAIAYVVNIVMAGYERLLFARTKKNWLRKCKRPLCMILAFLSILAVVALIISLVLPQLIECIRLVLSLLPGAIDQALDFIDKFDLLSDEVLKTLEAIDWKSRVAGLVDMLTNGVTDVVSLLIQTVSQVISGVITGFLSLIFSIYLLLSKEKLMRQLSRLCQSFLSPTLYGRILYVIRQLDISFSRYLVGQCTEAVILGLLCCAGMLLLRLPFAAMISALIAFTALIPIAGAYIGAFVGAFMILTVSPVKALIFLVFLVILQQLEGNLIYPRVVGTSMGLPGIWVLAAVTIGGGIAGIPGMFLGVPLAAALYRILRDILQKKEAESLPEETPPEEA